MVRLVVEGGLFGVIRVWESMVVLELCRCDPNV
jgi:hypothetical protein